MGQIGAVYGGALYAAAVEEEKADAVYEQVCYMQEMLSNYPQFMRLIGSKALSTKERKALIQSSLKGRLDELVINLIKTAIDKQREKYLPEMLQIYERRYLAAAGIVSGQLITAVPASEKQIRHLEKILSRKSGNQVMLVNVLDDSIVGGAVVRIGSVTIDDSIKGRLQNMKSYLNSKLSEAGDVQ